MNKEQAIEILKEIIDEGWLISDIEKCVAIDACDMAIETLEQEQRWIPCSEGLPKERGFYLVSTTDCITIMEFINKEWISQNLGSCNWYVKAWMPLPKPYKADMKSEVQ